MAGLKVLLVKPVSDMHVVLPPIGLGYLASYCQRDVLGLDLRILDCHREKYSSERFKQYVKKFKPDIIGFTALSMEINSALSFSSIA
ncbi:MAG: cobalamin B12-binding domain-containing protein, partial [Candidatus Omnitrophica bacterium]|nr:cobalamin B12-binding domain-containing protein [Candidatus Omnitrophota bacterium]